MDDDNNVFFNALFFSLSSKLTASHGLGSGSGPRKYASHQDHGGVVNIKTRRSLIPEVFFTWPGILRLWKQKDENFGLEAAVKAFYLLSRRM